MAKVPTPAERMAEVRVGFCDDGYEWMSRLPDWQAIPSWGLDGWDLGDWPLIVVVAKQAGGLWSRCVYCEGSVDFATFTTYDELVADIDAAAEWSWSLHPERHGDDMAAALAGPRPLPDRFRGPFSWARWDRRV